MKRINFSKQHLAAALLLLLLFSSGCGGEAKAPVNIPINTSTAILPTSSLPAAYPLPEPKTSGPVSLEAALQSRRSTRDFTSQELDPGEISQLLWAAQGIADPRGFRTAPSAGALYPLELYIVTADGVFHYLPQKHALEVIRGGDLHAPLHDAALGQDPVLEAPLVMVIAALYERTQAKYGPERSPRYVHLEAGHAAQNVLLQAVALDLGAVPIGAFYDAEVQAILGLPEDHEPLYLIPIGHPE
jgi:SagB-type dehydrogenase family enzyme